VVKSVSVFGLSSKWVVCVDDFQNSKTEVISVLSKISLPKIFDAIKLGANQMSGRCFAFLLVVLIVTVRASFGDVFVQKSGETIEGAAIEQDDNQLVIRPYIGDGATVTLSRADLANVLPDSQETADFLELRTEATIRTALGSGQFTEVLERRVPVFEAKYPSTKFRLELVKLVDQLKADQLRLANGSVKIAGVWLDHDQVNQAKYQVSAAMLEEAMASAEARGDWTSALNAFQNLRINFPASRAYVDGIDIAIRVLPQLRRLEEEKLQRYRLDMLRLNLNLAETPSHVRADLVRAERRESESIEAAIAGQRGKGMRWPTLFPRSEKGFDGMYEQIAQEISTLANLPRSKYRESIDAAISALQSIESRDAVSAKSFLEKAQVAWPDNEMIDRISQSIQEMIRASAAPSVQRAEPEQILPLLIIKTYAWSICAGGAAFCFLLAAIIMLRRTQRSRRRYIG
jgi:hypothetical protein